MATGSYARIRLAFWTDPDIKRVLTPEQKELLLYYFSSPHVNMIGMFYCPFDYVVSETGLTLEQVQEWTSGVLSKFVSYDPRTEEILVHAGARHQVAETLAANDKRVKAIVALVKKTHSKWLVAKFVELYTDWPLNVEKPDALPPSPHKPSPIEAPSEALRSHSSSIAVHSIAVHSVSNETGEPNEFQSPKESFTDGDLMALVRRHFYAPDGKPPTGWAEGREFSIFKQLRKLGYSGRVIAEHIEGAAAIRDDNGLVRGDVGRVDWLKADDKMTMRALYNSKSGLMDLWQLAEIKNAEMGKKMKPTLFDKGGIGAETLRRALGA